MVRAGVAFEIQDTLNFYVSMGQPILVMRSKDSLSKTASTTLYTQVMKGSYLDWV